MRKSLGVGICLLLTIASFGQPPKLEYGINFGGTVKFTDVDAAGNAYVTGVLEGAETYGSTTLFSNGDRDVFILKVSPTGTILWAKSFGGPDPDEVYAMDVHPDGQIVLAGEFQDVVDFDPGPVDHSVPNFSDGTDGYVLRLDTDGEFSWVGTFGGTENDGAKGVAFDSPSNVYVTGYFSGTADLDPTGADHLVPATGVDAFFVKLDEDGSFDWAQSVGNAEFATGVGATTDFTGTPIFTGHYYLALDIDPGAGTETLNPVGQDTDIFIVKLNLATGAFVWGESIGGDGVANIANSVYADGQNNIYVTGSFQGSGDFDPGAGEVILTAEGETSDIFITKLHPSGALLWAHGIGGAGEDWGAGVYSDGPNVYVTGAFDMSVDFDPGPGKYVESLIDQADAFILKLDAAGLFKWVTTIGDEEHEEGRNITGDAAGNIYTVGYFTSEPTDVDPSGCELLLDPEIAPSYLLKFGTTLSPCLTIYSQPQDVATCQGNTVTFTVGASGVNLTYQWLGQGTEGEFDVPISDNAIYSGSQTATLTVNTAGMSPGDFDAFVVEVNGDGFTHIFSEVVIIEIAVAPQVLSVSRCGPGEVTLKIPGAPPIAKYNWYTVPTGGTPIPGETGPTYTTPSLTVTTTYYVERELGFCQGPRAAVTAGIINCQPIPEFVWATSITSGGRIADMHVDRVTGMVYVAGIFSGSTDFDPGPDVVSLQHSGSTDVFVAKYNSAGELIWARKLGGTSQDDTNAITVDKDGNVLVAGYFLGTADFDPDPSVTFNLTSAGSWDTFISKLDGDGNFVWAKRIGGTPTTGDISSAIKTDASGNVYVAGSFTGIVDMDPGPGSAPATSGGNTDGLVLKLEPDGDYINSIILRGGRFDSFDDVEVDASGNIYATGYYEENTDFDPGAGTALEAGSNDRNAFVMKMNATGGLVWYKTFSEDDSEQWGNNIDLDSDGNIIVGGTFEGTIDFDPGTGTQIHTAVNRDVFTVKLDADGNFLWGKTLPGSSSAFGFSTVNGTDVYMFGAFFATLDADPGPGVFNVTSEGATDAHIVKLNRDGDFQWGLKMGGSATDVIMAIGFDDDENIYTGGHLSAPGDYDPGPDTYMLEPLGGGSFSASFVKLGAPSGSLTIITQPSPASACQDGVASFTVAATGTTNIQYQWQKYDDLAAEFDDLSNNDAFGGTTTGTLFVNTAGGFGAGKYRCVISGDAVADAISNEVDLTIVTALSPPTTQPTSRCGGGAVTVQASGSGNGSYRWYTSATGGAIAGELNDTYTTTISATTSFFVSVMSGSCESTRTSVTATVNPVPSAPTVVDITRCASTITTLTAAGGIPGGYRWYDVATGGSPIATTDTFTTPTLTATVIYFVSVVIAGCESAREDLTVTVTNCTNNQPPVIANSTSSASIQGTVSVNLTNLISDPDNNLDLATLRIVSQPKSGATATIDQNSQLIIDYSATSFAGEDELTIEICDIASVCAQQVIRINVSGEVMVYNAVSPNGDGKNDVFHVAYIDVIEETRDNKVTIFNRWGDVVFEIEDYNNTSNAFSGKNKNGNDLPSGTYFYRIVYNSGRPTETGYLSLKR